MGYQLEFSMANNNYCYEIAIKNLPNLFADLDIRNGVVRAIELQLTRRNMTSTENH